VFQLLGSAPRDLETRRFQCAQRFATERVKMLVEGYKVKVKAETEVKETVRNGVAKSLCRARECLAQCLLDRTSFLSSRVRFSKRETKPDVGLLLVPVCGATQLLQEKKSHPDFVSDHRQVPSEHPHVAALFSGCGRMSE